MGAISIRIDEKKRKILETIALFNGKTISGVVGDLIEEYVKGNRDKITNLSEKVELKNLMKLSEKSFDEWDNEEDEIYNYL